MTVIGRVRQIEDLIRPTIESLGYVLWGCEWVQSNGRVLRIYIDQAEGVRAGDCQRVAGQVGALLDVEDCVRGKYHLEISSPGLERRLFYPEQLPFFLGRRVKLRFRDAERRVVTKIGQLEQQTEGVLRLQLDAEAVSCDEQGANIDVVWEQVERLQCAPTDVFAKKQDLKSRI